MITIGCQIGRYNLIGIDYEIRISDVLVIHLGAVFLGYTSGMKIYFSPKKTSGFLNVSYKDLGFGALNGVGFEYGNQIPLSRHTSFGLHLQGGFVILTHIVDEIRRTLSISEGTTSLTVIGAGFSW